MKTLRILLVMLAALMLPSFGQSAQMYFIHSDQLGSPVATTDQNQAVIWKQERLPFGSSVEPEVSASAPRIGFPGQYLDRETNYHYNYYRDYDPAIGRYIESDPVGLHAGQNTYAYVTSNPILSFDIYGLWWDSIGVNLTFITEGEGTSTSFALASDGDGLYCVLTHQELSGTGYFYAVGGEAAIGSGELMPDDTKLLESTASRDYVRGVAGGLTSPIKVKGAFGFAGGLSTSGGEISGATGRRGPGIGGFTGQLESQETYKIKILPDYRIW
ncbi:RHS repeat domain-containing protein [Marinobacter bohaiensis]|uniref:RHS repeat domain-containing protein n=1 Tax=Marinobacter bohaiensis TaxID=2201898 RepID=UPI0019550889